MSIANSALLVDHNISVWTANKKDQSATALLLADNSASSDAATVNKNLMAGTHKRKAISDYAAKCRARHIALTLPWSDKGSRILPTSMFLDYKQEMNARIAHFDSLVDEFIDEYPNLVQQASNYHSALGKLFDPADYPEPYEVREMFGYRLVFSPIAESSDFRLDAPQQELEEVKRGYEESFNARLATTLREPWNRLHEVLSGISSKLGSESSKYQDDRFITNARSMCAMLTHLNVTKDPELEKARKQLEAALVGANVETLKDNSHAREEMKTSVDDILKQFDW